MARTIGNHLKWALCLFLSLSVGSHCYPGISKVGHHMNVAKEELQDSTADHHRLLSCHFPIRNFTVEEIDSNTVSLLFDLASCAKQVAVEYAYAYTADDGTGDSRNGPLSDICIDGHCNYTYILESHEPCLGYTFSMDLLTEGGSTFGSEACLGPIIMPLPAPAGFQISDVEEGKTSVYFLWHYDETPCTPDTELLFDCVSADQETLQDVAGVHVTSTVCKVWPGYYWSQCTIYDLSPSTEYKCNFRVKNSAGESLRTEETFYTTAAALQKH